MRLSGSFARAAAGISKAQPAKVRSTHMHGPTAPDPCKYRHDPFNRLCLGLHASYDDSGGEKRRKRRRQSPVILSEAGQLQAVIEEGRVFLAATGLPRLSLASRSVPEFSFA